MIPKENSLDFEGLNTKETFLYTKAFGMDRIEDALEKVRKILLWATVIILFLILISSGFLTCSLIKTKYPTVPDLGNISADSAKQHIENYKTLVNAMQTKQTNIYDFVVLKTLLDIFGSLINGLIIYVFANAGLQLFKAHKEEKNTT